jgi:hypothetical protein
MTKNKKNQLTSGLVSTAGGLPLGVDLYSHQFGSANKEAFSTRWELNKRLAELGYRFPTAHLNHFLGYARAGNVVGIRRPWPETFDALGDACAIRPETKQAQILHLALLFSQFTALTELNSAIKQAASKQATIKLRVSREEENIPPSAPEGDFGSCIVLNIFAPPEEAQFSVSTSTSADFQIVIDWALMRFSTLLEWGRKEPISDALKSLLKRPHDEVQTVLQKWREAAELFSSQHPLQERTAEITDTGTGTPASGAASSILEGLQPAGTDQGTAGAQSGTEKLPEAPRVHQYFTGRCGQWVKLQLFDDDEELLESVQIPVGLLRASATPAHEGTDRATQKDAVEQWTEGYHYYTLQPLGSAQNQATQSTRLNCYFNRYHPKGASSRVFRDISPRDGYSIDDESNTDLYRSGAIIFSPPWPTDKRAENRMSVHILGNEANKRSAIQSFFVDGWINKLKVWRIGRKNAVVTAGYLCAQSYIHVDHMHSIGLHTTSAKSFFAHQWHEFRFVDQLKSLTVTGAVAGASIATLATGGAPLLIALVGLGVSVALDPFASRITNASKQTKGREFVLEEDRLRTLFDASPSASKADVYRLGVKAAEKSLRKKNWKAIAEPPENALISEGNVPQDDVKDVGKLIRRAYVHLDVVRDNLEKLEKDGLSNASRDKLLGESLHHIDKTWRYLAPSVIFASAAYDVDIQIAKQWNKVYPAIEGGLIQRIYQLQTQKKFAWLLDTDKFAKQVMKWFKLDKKVTESEIIGWRGLGIAGRVPVHPVTDEKQRIIEELKGAREIIDPTTRKPISNAGNGRFSGTRTGYTTGAQVGNTLSDWLSSWEYDSDQAQLASSDDDKIDQLGEHITKMNTRTAKHLKFWGRLQTGESDTDNQNHDLLPKLPSNIQQARDKASNPGYVTKGKHYWSNWGREKTKGQKIQTGFQKFFGFGLTFGSPFLTQGAEQVVKVVISSSTNTFFMAGKTLGKFATKRQGVKKALKDTQLLAKTAAAHSALKPTIAQESELQQELAGFDFDLLKAGASFTGTSLTRKVAFRMYKAAATLNLMFPLDSQGSFEKRIVDSNMDDLVGVMRELYEYHHHMDKLEFYLMGLLTYLSILGDVTEAYEKVLLEKLEQVPIDTAVNLSEGLGSSDEK